MARVIKPPRDLKRAADFCISEMRYWLRQAGLAQSEDLRSRRLARADELQARAIGWASVPGSGP